MADRVDCAGSEVSWGRMRVGGADRNYRLVVPAQTSPWPLVVALHGGLQSVEGLAEMSGLDAEAERSAFAVVYPQGIQRTWNAGRCCGPAMRLDIDDIGFVVSLVDRLVETEGVDATRVYATGISNGGQLAYRLATEHADRFAAIAPVAASMVNDGRPALPMSVVHVHGTRDRMIPFVGGIGDRSLQRVSYPPVREVVDRWRRFAYCAPEPTTAREGPAEIQTWTAADGTQVVLCAIERGGHIWPGPHARFRNAASGFDATAFIWRFFTAHSRQTLT